MLACSMAFAAFSRSVMSRTEAQTHRPRPPPAGSLDSPTSTANSLPSLRKPRNSAPRWPIWRVLPWIDWVALAFFFSAWVVYAQFARRRAEVQPSLLALTNRERSRWMLQTTRRENRVVDVVVVQNFTAELRSRVPR